MGMTMMMVMRKKTSKGTRLRKGSHLIMTPDSVMMNLAPLFQHSFCIIAAKDNQLHPGAVFSRYP